MIYICSFIKIYPKNESAKCNGKYRNMRDVFNGVVSHLNRSTVRRWIQWGIIKITVNLQKKGLQ